MAYTGSIPDTATRRRDWTDQAACTGNELNVFFEHKHQRKALTACAVHCPVRAQCLANILSVERGMSRDHRYGIFAGLDGAERWQLDATAPGHTDDRSTLFRTDGPAPECGTPEALMRHFALAEPVDDRCWSSHLRRTHGTVRGAGTSPAAETTPKKKQPSGCGTQQSWYLHRRRKQTCRVCEKAHIEHITARRREVLAEEHLKGGSERGYMIHRRLGEPPCAACRKGAGRDRKARIVRESRHPKKVGLTAREQQVRELWAANLSDTDIGRQVGLSRSGVANIRRRLGLLGTPPSPALATAPEPEPAPADVPEPERQPQTPHERRIHALWATGASDFEIARRMAVSTHAVQRVRERLGLLPRLHTEKAS